MENTRRGEDTYEELASFVEEPEETSEPDKTDIEPDGYLQIDFEGTAGCEPGRDWLD